jgi:uncharacterized protein
MSSPQNRRADRAMSHERTLETVAQGYSGRLATVSEHGFPYCIPLLYLWINGEVYLHTASGGGHLRANVERDRRVCFEIDEQEGVFDYGRFECDSGLAYRSVCLFGQIRIVDDREVKQRFCEALMAKYGKPETKRPKVLPADRCHHRVCYRCRAHDRQGMPTAAAFRAVACERQDEVAKCFIAQGRSGTRIAHQRHSRIEVTRSTRISVQRLESALPPLSCEAGFRRKSTCRYECRKEPP